MYSDQLQQLLDDNGIEPGDRVNVTTGQATRQGRLMPRADQGDSDALVLKLDNGYNIGISRDNIEQLEKIGDTEETTSEEREIQHDPDNPDITILHTGGTIASRVSYREGGVKPAFEPEDLLELYPELFDRANIDSHVIAQMLSEDMEPGHWQQIAQAVADHRDQADGIIIGHGTDTMQFTAAALSFMLENIDIPVVLVGAQRSSDRPSSDAAMNLLAAAAFIKEDIPGVYVCMHQGSSDRTAAIHRGTRVRKMHTSRRDAFQSIGTEPVAEVSYPDGEVTLNGEPAAPDDDFRLRDSLNTNVSLLKTTPGLEPDRLEQLSDRDGIIIEGTGLGHMPVNSFDEHTQHHEEIRELLDEMTDDTVIAMTSQCINGRVNMNVYDAGVKLQEAGVIPAANMLPGTAYVKLMWALGQDGDTEDLFATNIAGETLPREQDDAYRS